MAFRSYTKDEDRLITTAKTQDLAALAKKLGRTRQNLLSRRARLLRGDYPVAKPKVTRKRVRIEYDPLDGRPSWFDSEEELRLRSRLVAGR